MNAGVIPAAGIAAAVAAARGFLRSDSEAEQALFERLAGSAIRLGEAFTGALLLERAVEEVLPVREGWQALTYGPVRAISGVSGLAVEDYAVDIAADGCGWVRVVRPGAATTVSVGYTAGLAATWDALPEPVAQGIVALIAHLFEDRAAGAQPPAAVAAMWRPFRRVRLMTERRDGGTGS